MSLEADYRALRRGLGAYALPVDVLSVAGADAAGYLQGQCSQDIEALAPGSGAPALVLEPDGKLCALVTVGRLADDRFVVAVARGWGQELTARLTRFRLRAQVAIEAVPWSAVALRGDGAAGMAVPGGGPEVVVTPYGHLGWEGYDLLTADPGPVVPAAAQWCSDPAWEACRVESGVPVMGRELDGRTIAAEAGLVAEAVSFTKGCYTGQELVARLDARGNRVARRLCGLVPEDADGDPTGTAGDLEGGVLRRADKEVGRVTSAAWCPGVGGAAALGYVHRSVTAEDVVTVGDRTLRVRELPLAR